MGERAPLEFCDKLFVLIVGELTGVVFEDGLGRFAGGRVKEHDRHVFAKRLGNAGYLLGQDPHGDAVVPCAEAEIDQLARAAFHVLGGDAVVEHKERVGPRKEVAGQSQPGLDLMLQAGNHENVRIAVHEALVGRVLDKSGAEEHDEVKAPPKGAPQQVQKILCFTRVGGPHDQGVEGQLFGIHASLYLCVDPRVNLHALVDLHPLCVGVCPGCSCGFARPCGTVPSTEPIPAAFLRYSAASPKW